MRWFMLILCCAFLTACEYEEIKREIGYKGKARSNPWLAAERFCERSLGVDVISSGSWKKPQYDDAIWFMPASVLNNQSFIRQAEEWMTEGGHLVVIIERANASNDWLKAPIEDPLNPECFKMLERNGVELTVPESTNASYSASEIKFGKRTYRVNASSASQVSLTDQAAGVFASTKTGNGRLSVLTDGKIFRNRWIAEKQHADFLDALILADFRDGKIGFIRGTGLSLWKLVGTHLWPLLIGLTALVIFWLWKNFSRFGPVDESENDSSTRSYDHHLEAIGDFQWRLDKAAGLIAPLRMQIIEIGQRLSSRAARHDEDLYQFLADRSGLPKERVAQALSTTPLTDSSSLVRTTADIQLLLTSLH